MLICKDCANKTQFRRNESGICRWSERRYIDESEEFVDGDGADYDDHETDDWSDLECSICDGCDVEDVDDNEWEAWEGPEDDEDDEDEEEDLPMNKPGEDETWEDYFQRKKRM